MYQTAWTKKGSSLPSDRIRPSYSQQSPAKNQSKSKGKQSQIEPPKSREVQRLEALATALRASTGEDKDPKGGCYCQARVHILSPYTPLCRACGLILCTINLPQYACPHCSTPLLTTLIRNSLLAKLDAELSDTIAQETQERERAEIEAKQAVGAFPTLSGTGASTGSPSSGFTPRPQSQTHKVLSLNSKTKKVIISSYTTTPVSSRPSSRAKSEEEEEPFRIPPPPNEVSYARKRVDPNQPWADLNGSAAIYIAVSRVDVDEDGNPKGKRKRRNKGKAKESGAVENRNKVLAEVHEGSSKMDA